MILQADPWVEEIFDTGGAAEGYGQPAVAYHGLPRQLWTSLIITMEILALSKPKFDDQAAFGEKVQRISRKDSRKPMPMVMIICPSRPKS